MEAGKFFEGFVESIEGLEAGPAKEPSSRQKSPTKEPYYCAVLLCLIAIATDPV